MSERLVFQGFGRNPGATLALATKPPISPTSTPANAGAPGVGQASSLMPNTSEMRALEAFGRVLPLTPKGRSAIASAMLAAMASAQATYAAQPLNQLWQTNPGEGNPGTGPGTGTGTGTGAGTWTGRGQADVASYWWGWQMCFDEEATKWVINGAGIGAGATALIGGAIVALTAGNPIVAAFVFGIITWLLSEANLIQTIDDFNGNNGVCLNMSWAAPGIFVPTAR